MEDNLPALVHRSEGRHILVRHAERHLEQHGERQLLRCNSIAAWTTPRNQLPQLYGRLLVQQPLAVVAEEGPQFLLLAQPQNPFLVTEAVRPPGAPGSPSWRRGLFEETSGAKDPRAGAPADHCLAGWPEDRGVKPRATSRLSRPKARMAMGLK